MGNPGMGAFVSDKVLGIIAVIAVAAGAYWASHSAAEKVVRLAAPAFDAAVASTQETAVFAGGCFWGVQAVFQHTAGVLTAVSGYAGGAGDTASYERVTSGQTGHAEAVQVTYDPRQISYGKLLQIYFSVAHDPTQLNRRGPTMAPSTAPRCSGAMPARNRWPSATSPSSRRRASFPERS